MAAWLNGGRRVWRRYYELPPVLVHALLAAEDVRFFAHDGVDLRGVARAALANYRAGRISKREHDPIANLLKTVVKMLTSRIGD